MDGLKQGTGEYEGGRNIEELDEEKEDESEEDKREGEEDGQVGRLSIEETQKGGKLELK